MASAREWGTRWEIKMQGILRSGMLLLANEGLRFNQRGLIHNRCRRSLHYVVWMSKSTLSGYAHTQELGCLTPQSPGLRIRSCDG